MASTSGDLFAAIDAGDVERVRSLLASDPELASARDAEGVSALMRARYRLDRELTQVVRSYVGEMDLFDAAAAGDVDRVTEVLADDPASVGARSGDGFTALHLAAFFGRVEAARLLVSRAADVDARGTGWMAGTALHSAVSGGSAEIVEALLEAGADPNARQAGGWAPLHSAAHNGDVASVTLLLASGADPAATGDDGTSVLELAHSGGDPATVATIAAALGR
jgi:ankyrin repeat protein